MKYYPIIIKTIKYFYIVFIFLFLKLFNIISFTQILLCYILYIIYVQYSSKATLYYTKNSKNDKILSQCPSLANPDFKPHFLLPFAFQQSFICASKYIIQKIPNKKLLYREEKINNYGLIIFLVKKKKTIILQFY